MRSIKNYLTESTRTKINKINAAATAAMKDWVKTYNKQPLRYKKCKYIPSTGTIGVEYALEIFNPDLLVNGHLPDFEFVLYDDIEREVIGNPSYFALIIGCEGFKSFENIPITLTLCFHCRHSSNLNFNTLPSGIKTIDIRLWNINSDIKLSRIKPTITNLILNHPTANTLKSISGNKFRFFNFQESIYITDFDFSTYPNVIADISNNNKCVGGCDYKVTALDSIINDLGFIKDISCESRLVLCTPSTSLKFYDSFINTLAQTDLIGIRFCANPKTSVQDPVVKGLVHKLNNKLESVNNRCRRWIGFENAEQITPYDLWEID